LIFYVMRTTRFMSASLDPFVLKSADEETYNKKRFFAKLEVNPRL